jgi:uncharacterized protein (AIM24 family)
MPRRAAILPSLLLAGLASGCTVNLYFYVDGTGGAGGTGGNADVSSTTSTGSGGGCAPGSMAPCYSGPAGTENKGICQAGIRTCSADGVSFGACAGEVLPKPENCATPTDDDCDGLAPACQGELLWSKRFGDVNEQVLYGVATDGAGNVIVAGNFGGTVDFGGGFLTSAGTNDIFVVKMDANGNHLWSKRFGDLNQQNARSVAVDAMGSVLVTGIFAGALDFGGGPLVSEGGNDIFVAKLDANGGHLWSRSFGGPLNQDAWDIATDSAGNVVLTGGFGGTVSFGGGLLTSAGSGDVFVAKLDSNGGHVWSESFGDAGLQTGRSIGVDPAGNVLVAGGFAGTVNFGGGLLTSAGSGDVFVAKLDGNGGHLWSKGFGDTAQQDASGLAVDVAGNVLITGEFDGTVDFGGKPLSSAGGFDLFVVKLDENGKHIWSERFGDIDDQGGAPSVAVDTSGNVFAAGTFHGAINFGGGPLASAGQEDAYLAKLDGNGKHLWSKRFGDVSDSQVATCLAVDGPGNVIVAGYFSGTVDFGAGPVISAGGNDAFVAKFSP